MRFIFILAIFFTYSVVKAQITSPIFVVIDKNNPNVKEEEFKTTDYGKSVLREYSFINKEKDWLVTFRSQYLEKRQENPMIILLPQGSFHYYKKSHRVLISDKMENVWRNTDFDNFYIYYKQTFSTYIQKSLDIDSKVKHYVKYNIFLIFSSDLDKEYIPCYEVTQFSLHKLTME